MKKPSKILLLIISFVSILSLCNCKKSIMPESSTASPSDSSIAQQHENAEYIGTALGLGNYELFLYKNSAVYSPLHSPNKIFVLVAGEAKPTCLLENGSLLDQCGSILFARSNGTYLAMDLDKGRKWVPLQPAPQGAYGFRIQDEQKIFFFGHIDSDEDTVKHFIDIIEFETLDSKRIWINDYIHQAAIDGNTIYLLCLDSNQNQTRLYCADLTMQKKELLCTIDGLYNEFIKVSNRIVLYDQLRIPQVYDIPDKTVDSLKFASTTYRAGTLFICPENPDCNAQVYNAATNKYQSTKDAGIGSMFNVLENGFINFPKEKDDPLEIHLSNESIHIVKLPNLMPQRILKQKANSEIGTFLLRDTLILIDWSSEEITQHSFREE